MNFDIVLFCFSDIAMDWSDHALWWPDKNTWLVRTRSTLDQYGVQADARLLFTPMHKTVQLQLPDLQIVDMRVNFSRNVFANVIHICKELGKYAVWLFKILLEFVTNCASPLNFGRIMRHIISVYYNKKLMAQPKRHNSIAKALELHLFCIEQLKLSEARSLSEHHQP